MPNFSSSRTSRLKSSKYLRGKSSKSPTLTSSRSQKSLWARSYKNQPIPTIIGRRILRQRYKLTQNSDEQEEIVAVQQQEEQQNVQKKKRRLPIFKVISDYDEFSDHHHGCILSQRKRQYSSKRCRSVQSLKLPQVQQYQKQEDELRKKTVTKLPAIRDNNQFGQKRTRRSSSSYTQVVSRVESLEIPIYTSGVYAEQIEQNEAQQTKSVKLSNQKSIITSELQKLIVDELDQKRKKKEQVYKQQIESIIQEEKHEEQIDTQKLRFSLQKFEQQSEYLNKMIDGEHESDPINSMRYSNNKSQKNAQIVHQEQQEKDYSDQNNRIVQEQEEI